MALNCGIFNFLGARDGKRYWADCRLMLLLDFLDLQMWICTKYWGEVFFWHVFFWLWLWAFGFWLLRFLAFGLYLLHFGAKISDLRAICCSLETICMPFWLLASGSFGFWLLACICCILEPKSLICVLFAAVWSQFACPFGFWLLAFGFGFTWLLAFGFWFLLFFVALVSLGFWLLAALLLNVCVVL